MEEEEVIFNRDILKSILTREQNKLTECKFKIQKYKLRLKEIQGKKGNEGKLIKSCCHCSCSCQHPRSHSPSLPSSHSPSLPSSHSPSLPSSLFPTKSLRSLSIPDLRKKCQELTEINDKMASQVNAISSAFHSLTSSSQSSLPYSTSNFSSSLTSSSPPSSSSSFRG